MNEENLKPCTQCDEYLGRYELSDLGLLCIHCYYRQKINNLLSQIERVHDESNQTYDKLLENTKSLLKVISDPNRETLLDHALLFLELASEKELKGIKKIVNERLREVNKKIC